MICLLSWERADKNKRYSRRNGAIITARKQDSYLRAALANIPLNLEGVKPFRKVLFLTVSLCVLQAEAGSALGPAADMHAVRWALWSPFLGTDSSPVVLPLRGGARRSPGQALVFRAPANSESSEEVRDAAPGR